MSSMDLAREFGRTVELVPVSEEELADGIRRAYAAAEIDGRSGERSAGTAESVFRR